MRHSCFDCVRKHLAQALVIAHELPHYSDYAKDMHLWVFVGHMAEAADQVQREAPNVASRIREIRLAVMEDLSAIYTMDINALIVEVTELAELTQDTAAQS